VCWKISPHEGGFGSGPPKTHIWGGRQKRGTNTSYWGGGGYSKKAGLGNCVGNPKKKKRVNEKGTLGTYPIRRGDGEKGRAINSREQKKSQNRGKKGGSNLGEE